MSLRQCVHCGDFFNVKKSSRHDCKPFPVRVVDDRFAVKIFATSPHDAAIKWAEADDCASAEYSIASGRYDPIVEVECPDGSKRRYRVRGEAEPVYYADEIEGEQEGEIDDEES